MKQIVAFELATLVAGIYLVLSRVVGLIFRCAPTCHPNYCQATRHHLIVDVINESGDRRVFFFLFDSFNHELENKVYSCSFTNARVNKKANTFFVF